MSQIRIHYRRRNRKRHFVHASGINAEELREGDRVSYEEEEKEKGKLSSSYLSKICFFDECLKFDLFRNVFLYLKLILMKTDSRPYL
jgi:hypothetical protein